MRIALIRAGVVENIIEAELSFAQTLGFDQVVEAMDGAYLHGRYEDGHFVPPPVPEPGPVPVAITVMTKLSFLRRFTQAERLAIRAAKATDPVIEDADALMQLAEEIDVADPDTVHYVGYLAQQGLIAPSRVAEILAEVSA